MELERDCEYLSGDNSGMLYLSPGIQDVIGVKDGKKVLQTTIDGDLNMHPSGEWGISFWSEQRYTEDCESGRKPDG